jgi:hypothetical protein
MDFYILRIAMKILLDQIKKYFIFNFILYKMSSKLQYDNTGIGCSAKSTSYVMLENYCGPAPVPLGVKNVAPTYMPYGADPMFQNIPVFMGTNYNEAPYVNPRMFCGSCGGSYCNALAGYHVPVDAKTGNPIAEATYNAQGGRNPGGYESVVYVPRGPNASINQTCATSGSCNVSQLLPRK